MRIIPVPADAEELLLPFLQLCVNWSIDRPHLDVDAIRADDQLLRYVTDWGRDGDLGVMAIPDTAPGGIAPGDTAPGAADAASADAADGPHGRSADASAPAAPAGAAWIRIFADDPGFGWVSDSIPELSVAVLPEHQGEGIGRRLISTLIQMARLSGVEAISLAVEEGNGARHLYDELGFVAVGSSGNSVVMLLDLAPEA
ncbi:hypothetical protein GCM10022261_27730 [Brevibacterium daeguense]|uniref:N-acetyltransferase domain-containing protein n=1 Tax=Brevibacterium daeguense TaxID=909936 RepID=A0ABP8EMS1_9MICO|nr:GNAT family N-acetyltransferase [Brevibacterium daeguense]